MFKIIYLSQLVLSMKQSVVTVVKKLEQKPMNILFNGSEEEERTLMPYLSTSLDNIFFQVQLTLNMKFKSTLEEALKSANEKK